MGATTSSSREPRRSISLEPVMKRKSKKQNGEPMLSRKRHLRCSKNRPVLQLQVKPTTLERVRRRVGSASSSSFSRNTYTSMSRDSAVYDNLNPRARTVSNGSRSSTDHAHNKRTFSTTSRDSMVLLQIVGGEGRPVAKQRDDAYDHLVSKKEFGHLCECTYGRVDVQVKDDGKGAWHDAQGAWNGEEGQQLERRKGEGERGGDEGAEGAETHKADVIYCQGKNGCVHHGLRHSQLILRPPSLLLNVDEVKRRIQYHQRVAAAASTSPLPPGNGSLLSPSREGCGPCELSGSLRKSKSTSELLNHQVARGDDDLAPSSWKGLTTSQSSMDGWSSGEETSEWTLGESVMRALSRRDLLVIDMENPQTQSEFEIIEAWPRLREELQRLNKSQSTGDIATAAATISH